MGTRWFSQEQFRVGDRIVRPAYSNQQMLIFVLSMVIAGLLLAIIAFVSRPLHVSEFECFEDELMVVLPPGPLPAYVDEHSHCIPIDNLIETGDMAGLLGHID